MIDDSSRILSCYKKVNNTKVDYNKARTIHSLIEEQAALQQDRIAIRCKEKSLSYTELNLRASYLASILIKNGVKQGEIVGLIIDRSIDMFIAILAILKAGAGYLPMDAEYPQERIKYMVQNSGIKIILSKHVICSAVEPGIRYIYLDDIVYEEYKGGSISVNCSSHSIAYVVYTSGSTGKPKGVAIEHRAIHNFIVGMNALADWQQYKIVLCVTTIAFDIFVLESLLPLVIGLGILIGDPLELYSYLCGSQPHILQTTPSTMQLLLDEPQNVQIFQNLTDIFIGGEPLKPRLLAQLKSSTKARIFNVYGPSETTVWSAAKEMTFQKNITLGKPLANTFMYVINEGKIADVNERGELYIGGDGLAAGYLNNDELTKKKFIQVEGIPCKRLYRTGDYGKLNEDREFVFLGREDAQVKIRGYRIELGEVENNLGLYPQIKECVVIVKQNQFEQNYMVAYYCSKSRIANKKLSGFLAKKIPKYMIPGYFVWMKEFPYTLNNKIDKNAMSSFNENQFMDEHDDKKISELSSVEQQILDIWKELLNAGYIRLHDSFFDVGGDSILVSKLYLRINHLFPSVIDLTDLFIYKTVSELSEHIAGVLENREKRKDIVRIKKSFADSISERVKQAAEIYDINMETIYLAAFIFLLSQLSGNEKFSLRILSGRKLPVMYTADISNENYFYKYCKILDGEKRNYGQYEIISSKEKENYPCFGYKCNPGSGNFNVSLEFGDDGRGDLTVSFRKDMFDSKRYGMFAIQYIELIEKLCDEIPGGDR